MVSVPILSIRRHSNRGSQIPEPLLMFTSGCPSKLQVSQGLGPFFQIELLKTGRTINQGSRESHTLNDAAPRLHRSHVPTPNRCASPPLAFALAVSPGPRQTETVP